MKRTKHQERFIKAETIRIGDVIRITWKQGDVTQSAVGKVAERKHHNGNMTEWLTAGGIVLLVRFGIAQPLAGVEPLMHPATITLLEPAPEMVTQLSFDITL